MSATFVLLPTDPKDKAKSDAVVKFFEWGFAHGDDLAKQMNYVVLPPAIKDAVRAAVQNQVKG